MPQVSQSTDQQTPAKELPKNISHKINWLHIVIGVIIGVILIGAGFGVYLLTQSEDESTNKPIKVSTPSAKQATPSATATPSAEKDETASWKTLTNTELGYSIKYPKSWKTKRCAYPAENNSTSDLMDPTRVEYTTGDVCGSGLMGNILIVIGKSDKNYSQKLAEWSQYYSSAEHSNYKKTNVKVGGLGAVKFSATTTDQNLTFGKKVGVILFRYLIDDGEDKPLEVWYTQDTTDDNHQSVFEKMLSTFKFLE